MNSMITNAAIEALNSAMSLDKALYPQRDSVSLYRTRQTISGHMVPQIDSLIYNPPATIVNWKDGTKTVVKCDDNDSFSKEFGLAMAYMSKIFGSRSAFKRVIQSAYCPQEKKIAKSKSTGKCEVKTINNAFGENAFLAAIEKAANSVRRG